MCGGTQYFFLPQIRYKGLSPRVRGNLCFAYLRAPSTGSIPACAGEPTTEQAPLCIAGVYPRVCGGTYDGTGARAANEGLSPRVRGNRADDWEQAGIARSIPACAGEPRRITTAAASRGVYPRVCGGTKSPWSIVLRSRGLSPRVRGNRQSSFVRPALWRSIPACAGEPKASSMWKNPLSVYPRVCGGTAVAVQQDNHLRGLSPRVRGNLLRIIVRSGRRRSIPACAGEPRHPRRAEDCL